MLTTEVRICTSVDGKPTFMISRTLTQSGFSVKANGISGFHFLLIIIPARQPTNWPMTVASAAPAVSIRGRPNQPKIKIGSRIRFVSDAAESVKIKRCAFPLAMTNRSKTHCPIWPRDAIIQILKYWMPYAAIASLPPD